MPENPKLHVLDARTLRGLAHPLRMRLLSALRRGGPATASRLAAKLGESSGATSYHLRQLAAYGFVEDAPEHGKGRERWWRAVDEGVRFDDELLTDPDPAVRGAASVFMHEVAGVHAQELSTYVGTIHEWGEEWFAASDISDFTLRLTPELAGELGERMHDLIESYRARALPEGSPGAEQVRLHTHVFPTRTDRTD
ncbi:MULTISPECIES: ArsR/SmtB family transcription factor [unclassified Streptomyces]|uniref:ArsR/SmtB family transcription factor n=1 Tax=unclassified Streptomyces TaxID=2593676 RepID=UPI003D70C856